jgi:thioredoxin-like negative regulator of GroEL
MFNLFKNTEEKQMTEQTITKDGINLYSADWCSGCKMLKAQLDNADVGYNYIDIDTHSDLAAQKNIRGIPYTEILKGGDTLKVFTGANDYKEIIEIGRTL